MLLVSINFQGEFLGYFALLSTHRRFTNLDLEAYSLLEDLVLDANFYRILHENKRETVRRTTSGIRVQRKALISGKLRSRGFFFLIAIRTIVEELNCLGGYFHLYANLLEYTPTRLNLNPAFASIVDALARKAQSPPRVRESDPDLGMYFPYGANKLVIVPIVLAGEQLGSFGVFLSGTRDVQEVTDILERVEDSVIDTDAGLLRERESRLSRSPTTKERL